mmetsp:Transcript_44107/g.114504  ORF Transcript_44107/g.114504 Transcript_44107/m.114504 type:complete len:679 (-) Transcript_44107:145-2181(-)
MFSSKVKDEIVSSSSDESSSGEEETSELRVHFEENGGRGVESADLYRDVSAVDTEILMRDPPSVCTDIKPSAYALPPASLTFRDLSFSLEQDGGHCSCFRGTMKDRPKKVVLAPCSGHFEPGELTAIMGPSGSGKTTLLDMLAMKKTSPYEGEVFINGRPRDVRLFRRIAAYVGQEDIMPAHWKVREAILFNATLKYCTMRSHRDDDAWVDVLLETFGLAPVQDSLIGGTEVRGISGGQRRRVSLARGVAAHASLLFCDEPTSGLSATDAELCVKALRIMAKKFNVLTMVVIHQPRIEVANLFDRLVLLTANPGRMIYNGKMSETMAYWISVGYPVPQFCNPTDVYLDYITPGGQLDHVDEFVAAYSQRLEPGIRDHVDARLQETGMSAADMIASHHRLQEIAHMGPAAARLKALASPFHRQVSILLHRKKTLTMRNKQAIIMPIVVPVLVGFLLGVMFMDIGSKPFQQRLSFVFMLLTRICMGGMQLMPQLIDDRTIMKYDISERLYSIPAFIIVGVTVDISLSLIGAILNALIMYWLSGMDWKYFGMILMWALINFFVFDSFFSMLAAGSPSLQTAQVAAIPFNSIFMMFSGFMISKKSAPSYLTWIFEISPIGYAIQSIFCTMAKDAGEDGALVIQLYGFEEDQEMKGIIIMLVMALVFRAMQVLFLQYKNNIQK